MQLLDRPSPDDGSSVELESLIAACAESRAAALRARSRCEALLAQADAAKRGAVAARMASRRIRQYARIEGMVDGRKVAAVVFRDGGVTGDLDLLTRVDLVVSLGETFDEGDIVASRGRDPLATTLAATRACDRVDAVDVFAETVRATRVLDLANPGCAVAVAQGCATVRISGEIDIGAVEELGSRLEDVVRSHPRTTLDLFGVRFMDAAGLSVLLRARRLAQECTHDLVIRGATGLVRRVFDLCGVGDLLED